MTLPRPLCAQPGNQEVSSPTQPSASSAKRLNGGFSSHEPLACLLHVAQPERLLCDLSPVKLQGRGLSCVPCALRTLGRPHGQGPGGPKGSPQLSSLGPRALGVKPSPEGGGAWSPWEGRPGQGLGALETRGAARAPPPEGTQNVRGWLDTLLVPLRAVARSLPCEGVRVLSLIQGQEGRSPGRVTRRWRPCQSGMGAGRGA